MIVTATKEIQDRGCSVNKDAVPAGLKRNELTPYGKREHLAQAYKITGADADKIITDLYGGP